MEEQDYHKQLRVKIKAIMDNKSLTPQERSKQIQELMSSGYTKQNQTDTPNINNEKEMQLSYFDTEKTILGCKHYRKNCKIRAFCCKRFFTCRRCHDEEVTDHKINRYETETMLCMFCNKIQDISQNCNNCNKKMAKYYCNICKFFDDDLSKKIFHCDKCGICRVGGRENYNHCDICHMCVPKGGHNRHYERAFESNCPICGDWLQTSTLPSTQPLPCLHPIHHHCLKSYIKAGHYTCPICSKTYNECARFMKAYWSSLVETITNTPMPPEYSGWEVEILCNDCNIKSRCKYHLLGHFCNQCKGFNIKITKTMRPDEKDNNSDKGASE